MAYGSSHTSTLPTVGSTAGPTYATQINAAIQELRDTLDTKVTPAGMDMNANLSFLSGGSYYAVTDLERLNLENKSGAISAATFPRALYIVSGNLYYNDSSGNQIQLTSAGAVNTGSTGGITGAGYGTAGVEVNWDAGTTEYRMKSGSGSDDFADISVDDVLFNDGSSNQLRMAVPAMSSDYTMTLPAAVPGSTSLVTMSSAGALATTRDPSVDTVTTTGNITIGAGSDLVLSGTGVVQHGSKFKYVSCAEALIDSLQPNFGLTSGTGGYISGIGGGVMWLPVSLDKGARLIEVLVSIQGDPVDTITARLMSVNSGATIVVYDTATSLTPGVSAQTLALLGTGSEITLGSAWYYVQLNFSASDSDLRVYGMTLEYDQQ